MVTAHFTWNLENLRKGCAMHWKTLDKVWLTPYLGIIFLAAGIYGAFIHPGEWKELLWGVLLGLLFLSLRRLTLWQLERVIRRSPHYGTEMTYTFDPHKIANFGDKHYTFFGWKQLASATITHDGILLCVNKNLFHWIPVTAFESPSDMKTVEGYLKENEIRTRIV